MLRRICLISILRAIWISALFESSDFSWDFVAISNWSSVEVSTAIICACLLVTKPLFATLWHKLYPPSAKSQTESSGQPRTIGSGTVLHHHHPAHDELFAFQGNSFVSDRPLIDDPEALPMHDV